MNKKICADLFRHGGLTGILGLLKGLLIPGFKYMYFFRKAERYKKLSLHGIFYRLLLRKYSYKYGIQIPITTNIGKGLYIGHFGTIVINSRAIIGNNCNIAHNVTIGMAYRGEKTGTPTIGDRVWIGTGAVIVGKINIGQNVLIAPLTYVNCDVPNDCIVIGNPARIIANTHATDGYINYILK